MALVDEAEVGLMHERGRLQRVVRPLVAKLPCGDATELRIDEWEQLIERGLVATTPIAQQRRDVAGSGHSALRQWVDSSAQHTTNAPEFRAFAP
jgi:hypothetical protein